MRETKCVMHSETSVASVGDHERGTKEQWRFIDQ